MKKRIIAVMLILAFVLSGCALVDRFEEAKAAYLETRVVELMEEDASDEVEAEVVEPEAEVEAEESEPADETETVEDAESKEAVETEEPEESETEEDLEGEVQDMEDSSDEEDVDADDEEDEASSEDDSDIEMEDDEEDVFESDDPGIYLGDPDWMDDMEPGEYYWDLSTDDYMSVAYDDGTLQMKALSELPGWRIASTPVLGDAYIEAVVTMGKCAATDGYGIIFRVPENVAYNRGYFFGVTCDGKFGLRSWDGLAGENGSSTWLNYYESSDYVIPGEGATNMIGVMTLGDTIELYINGELVDTIEDDTYDQGYFGLYLNRDRTENLTINVDKVSYWTDPLE